MLLILFSPTMQHSKYLARFQTSAPPCRTLQANRSAEIRYQPEEADPEKKVVAALERHVQYLEKQLRESQQQGRETAEWLRTARAAREEEARTWRQKCQEAERLRTAAEEQLSLKEAELERWQLRQKMESIGGELQRQKQSQTSLKHRSPRGKFSGSPTHAFHQQEPIDELRCSQQLIRNPMSGVLIDEWQRFREEKELADKQVAVLEGKLTNLRREVVRQDRELASLKAAHAEKEKELRLANCELMQTRERIRQLHRHHASSSRNAHKWEEMADEGVGDGKEEEPCSSNSTTATDVQLRPRRTALSLRIVEVCVQPQPKQSSQCQTDETTLVSVGHGQQQESHTIQQQQAKAQSMQNLVMQLTDQLVRKNEQHRAHITHQILNHQTVLQGFQADIEEYKYQIEDSNLTIAQLQQALAATSHPPADCQFCAASTQQAKQLREEISRIKEEMVALKDQKDTLATCCHALEAKLAELVALPTSSPPLQQPEQQRGKADEPPQPQQAQ